MEKAVRYSKKREAILDAIRATDTHPSADWVYQSLKGSYPDLSLGTVYRNLTRFKDEGLIISVGTVNGQERFDGNIKPHAHFICSTCGSVLDFHSFKLDESLDRATEEQYDVHIDHHELTFHGTCARCTHKKA